MICQCGAAAAPAARLVLHQPDANGWPLGHPNNGGRIQLQVLSLICTRPVAGPGPPAPGHQVIESLIGSCWQLLRG